MLSYLRNLKQNDHPFKYLFSRFLVRTGLCRLFTIKTNGYKIRFFPTAISHELFLDSAKRQYEMLPFIKKGDIIIDVGANIGTTVIPSAMYVGEKGKIIAFEANPVTYGYLKSNIELNELSNVELHNCTLSDKEGEICVSNNEDDAQNSVSEKTE